MNEDDESRPAPAKRAVSRLRQDLIDAGVITREGEGGTIGDPITEFQNIGDAPVLGIGQIYGYSSPGPKPATRRQKRKRAKRGPRV